MRRYSTLTRIYQPPRNTNASRRRCFEACFKVRMLRGAPGCQGTDAALPVTLDTCSRKYVRTYVLYFGMVWYSYSVSELATARPCREHCVAV